jgi:regulator of protease activity HflC (stomatin/prohibitin superfamily)
MENKKAEANQQGKLVEAEMGVSIERKNKERRVIEAEASRDSATIEAEGKANATRTNGQAEADMIRTVGEAKASSYKSQVDALGSRSVAAIEMLTKVADGQIKITPDILVNGNNGERGSLLDVFFAQQLGQREKMAETKTEVTA